jgi:hypothetical protein
MAGPLKFDITFVSSPIAQLGILEYRTYDPNTNGGIWSNWHQDSTLGTFPINTVNGTVLTHTITGVPGDGVDFRADVVYEFRIQQFCSNGGTVYSDVTSPIFQPYCMPWTLTVNRDYYQSGYSFSLKIYDPSGIGNPLNPSAYSIVSYHAEVYLIDPTTAARTSIGIFNVLATDLIPGDPYYDLYIDNNNLVQPLIQSGNKYEVDFSYVLDNGLQAKLIHCNTLSVKTPSCQMYRIFTGEWWVLEWTDCSGVARTCYNAAPFVQTTTDHTFYICSITEPKGYACREVLPGIWKATPPAYLDNTGTMIDITNPVAYPDPVWLTPQGVTWGAVVQLVDPLGCDWLYSGDLPTILYDSYSATFTCQVPNCQ